MVYAPLGVGVFVYEQSRVCYYCCNSWGFLLQGQWRTPPPSLSLSTAGVAVSDNRVSAAAADQASLPGLGARGNTRILAQTGLRVHIHACGPASLSHMNTDSNACTHTMSPALKKSALISTGVVMCGPSSHSIKCINIQLLGDTLSLYLGNPKQLPASSTAI